MRNATLRKLTHAHGPVILVEVAATAGSTPREEGAWMVVAPGGAFSGTIGGGALEWRALAEAQAMLERAEASRSIRQSLGPDLGQCCGGNVSLQLTRITPDAAARLPEDEDARRELLLFGAGHVGRALVLALSSLPFRVKWIDSRPGQFPAALPANVTALEIAPEAEMARAGPGAFVLILTHSHALDLALTAEALKNPAIAYLGLIGSATKKARFFSRLSKAGWAPEALSRVVCPIGLPGLGSKLPAAIAVSVAADLLIRDERLKIGQNPLTARAGTA